MTQTKVTQIEEISEEIEVSGISLSPGQTVTITAEVSEDTKVREVLEDEKYVIRITDLEFLSFIGKSSQANFVYEKDGQLKIGNRTKAQQFKYTFTTKEARQTRKRLPLKEEQHDKFEYAKLDK